MGKISMRLLSVRKIKLSLCLSRSWEQAHSALQILSHPPNPGEKYEKTITFLFLCLSPCLVREGERFIRLMRW